MRSIARDVLTRLLARWGYELRRMAPVDLRDQGDVRMALHAHGRVLRRPAVVDVPLGRCRGLTWFPFKEERHPFVAALAAYRHRGIEDYERSPLVDYYASHQPATAAEAFGLSQRETPHFASVDVLAYCMPWEPGAPARHRERRIMRGRKEAREHGFELGAEDGTTYFGPVSAAKGQLEMRRLIAVYESIKREGYRRHDGRGGDVGGILFLGPEGDWCVGITGGQHRVAAAAALGLRSLPVRFSVVPVHPGGVNDWPQVRAGRITRDGALDVFDRVLGGRPPTAWRPDGHVFGADVSRPLPNPELAQT